MNTGTNDLDAAIRSTNGPISVAGLSQGTLALDREQARLAHDPTAPPPDQLTFIKAGDPNNLLFKAFGPGTHVPIIDYTVPAPVDSQYHTINIVGQYDPFSDPPNHAGNLLADLNAIAAGGYYGHSATAFSDPARVAPWDITRTTNSLGGTTTTYFIRSGQLPLVRALVDMAGLPPEAAGPLEAVLRPMIDRAYDPGPAPNPGQLVNGIRHIPAIGPATSIPIESTAGGTNAAASTPHGRQCGPKCRLRPQGGQGGQGCLVTRRSSATQRQEIALSEASSPGVLMTQLRCEKALESQPVVQRETDEVVVCRRW